MFMQRLITSLVLIPLVLCVIFYAPWWILTGIVFIVYLAMGWESLQLIPLHTFAAQIAFLVLLYLGLWLCGDFYDYWMTLGLLLWMLNCLAILTYPASQRYWGYPVFVAVVLMIVLPLFVQSLIHLYQFPQGKALIVYLLFLIWAADIGAYLAGKSWGKHKLIPDVSPGKSWEGIAGGLVLALLIAVSGYFYFVPYFTGLWFVLALITVILSIFGDLFISILKRRCHLKDTGTLIPGHGGILDRLDSLIVALPVFSFGLTFVPMGI